MADNYLEKRMEDYQRERRVTRAVPQRGRAALRYKPQTVALVDLPAAVARAMVEVFRDGGCRVLTIAETDPCAGCGARFYPKALGTEAILADIASRGEHIDVAVVTSAGGITAGRIIYIGDEAREGVTISPRQPRLAALMAFALADADSEAVEPQLILT